MSLLANIQEAQIKWGHRLNHTDQGEASRIYFLKMTAGTNAMASFVTIEKFELATRTLNGGFLPDGAQFELRIAESLLTAAQVKEGSAWKHGDQTYQVIQPAPTQPSGPDRVWRFWLARAERSS